MIAVSVADVAALLDAEIPSGSDEKSSAPTSSVVSGLVVDSRLVQPGSLFVALPGEHADGHDFVASAFAAGAVAAVVARPVPDTAGPCLLTEDPLLALGRIARDQVDRGCTGGLRVAAITGSQGKTSTKDLLAQVLETAGSTVAPYGNFNNEVGLPLTVARLEADTRFLVAEMGARGVGHIAYLCEIAPPEVGVVLNVGSAHLGEFGSVAAIAAAKGELVEALPGNGVAVLNADDPRAWGMRTRTEASPVGYSVAGRPPSDRAADDALWASDIDSDLEGRCHFRVHSSRESDPQVEVHLQVAGRHQVANALAVLAAARALGLSLEQCAEAIGRARPRSRWRMEMRRRPGGGLVINDAYNANPESMRAAVDTLTEIARSAGGVTSWAVLGDMLELGANSAAEHRTLGRYVAERGVSRLVVVGEFAADVVAGASENDPRRRPEIVTAPDRSAAVAAVLAELEADDVVLVKASRGLALDTVAEEICGADPDSDPDSRPRQQPNRPTNQATGDRE